MEIVGSLSLRGEDQGALGETQQSLDYGHVAVGVYLFTLYYIEINTPKKVTKVPGCGGYTWGIPLG